MEEETVQTEPGHEEEPPPEGPPPVATSGSSGGSFRRLWWLWVLIALAIVFLVAFLVGRWSQQQVTEVTTTTFTQPAQRELPAPTVVITEKQDGATVDVGIGWVTLLQLTGNPDDGSVWDVKALNSDLMQVFPGPQISQVSYAPTSEAVYTYAALTLAEGEVQVEARNLSSTGEVNKTFSCTIRVLSASALSTTTTTVGATTTAQSTGTTASTSTEVPGTTSTVAPTSTTAGLTTTSQPPTATTTLPTTTTKPATPTTKPTTTKPAPTTTTKPPATTTTTSPIPPIDVPSGYSIIGPRANGHVEVVATTAKGLKLALPDDSSDSYQWHLAPYDETVLKSRGEPEFVPLEPGSSKGARVWTFDILGKGATDLEAQYEDSSESVSSHFFVSISVQELLATPY